MCKECLCDLDDLIEARVAQRTAALEAANQSLAQELAECRLAAIASAQERELDMSSRKLVEEELRHNERRYRQIVETTTEGIWILDVHSQTTFVNRQMADMLGYTVDQMLGTSMFDYMDDEWRAIAAGNLKRRQNGVEEQHDFKFQRKDGTPLWAIIATNPLYDDAGSYTGALGMITDITARKCNEEALRDSQHLLQMIAEATPDLIYVWDVIEQRDLFINRSTPAALGYSAEAAEQIGADPLRALMHPDDFSRIDLIQQQYRRMCAGEIFENEYRLRHANGEWRWFNSRDLVLSWAPNGQTKLMIGTSQDITNRRQAEDALAAAYAQLELLNVDLRRSRDLLRALFDRLKDGLMLLDQHGQILAINQSLAALLGGSVGDLTGQHLLALCERSTTTPSPCAWVLDTLCDGRVRQERERISLPDGTLRILDVEVFPIINTEQVVEQIIVHTIDVTERLQIEAQMIDQELFAANGRLAATVAHEVNTPLQAVESCLHLVEHASTDHRAEYLKIAREEVFRVGQILRQLLDTFRPSQPDRAPIELNTLIGRALLLTGSSLAKQGIDVESDLMADLPTIWGRGDEITQVLINLVVNASHALPHGGKLCLITAIEQNGSERPVAAIIKISDTGIGMSDELQARIFEPFFTTKASGSGLGLAISQKIITQHGGTITVQSQLNRGSTFTISLPMRPET